MGFDPDTITQEKLHELRRAAEHAWSDETRHEDSKGHPQPSAGQCYVTSRWLLDKLGGGHIGTKRGHYFWVSPDKNYIVDLTGDQDASGPMKWAERLQDDEDEPFKYEAQQMRHRPGPIIYTSAKNPLYQNFRVKEYPASNGRADLFAERANAALQGKLIKSADAGGSGSDAYPGQDPQAEEEFNLRDFHDPVIDDLNLSMEEPVEREYKFLYGNGEFKVSPVNDHETMANEALIAPDHNGPMAVGYVRVRGRDALWSVESNIGLRGLVKMMKDYSKQAGWKWGGLVDGSGQPVHEEFAAKKSIYYGSQENRIKLSQFPFWGMIGAIEITGKTAHIESSVNPWIMPALEEWAKDFGYRIAEYPGGTDMNDRIKNKEWPTTYDKGDPEADPGKAFEGEPKGELTCPYCHETQPDFKAYVMHTKEHQDPKAAPIDDGHFPTIEDKDEPLPLRPRNVTPTAIPVMSSWHFGQDIPEPAWKIMEEPNIPWYQKDKNLRPFHKGDKVRVREFEPEGEDRWLEGIYQGPDPHYEGSHYVRFPGFSNDSWVMGDWIEPYGPSQLINHPDPMMDNEPGSLTFPHNWNFLSSWNFEKTADKLHDFLMNPKSRPDLQTPAGQRWLTFLQGGNLHNEKTDPLMPWLTREWKKGRINVAEYPDRFGEKMIRHIAIPSPGGGSEPLGRNELNHWGDFLKSNHPIRRGLGDIMQHDISSFKNHIGQWDQAMKEEAEQKSLKGGQVVHQWPDNWTIRRLNTPEELEGEGNAMGHCVGSYAPAVQRGDTSIYSLRDPQGVPHVTTEIEPDYRNVWNWPALDRLAQVNKGWLFPKEKAGGISYEAFKKFAPKYPEEVLRGEEDYPGSMMALAKHPDYTKPEINGPGKVVQIQGKANKEPLPEYQARMRQWFESLPEMPSHYDEEEPDDWIESPEDISEQHFTNPGDRIGVDAYGLPVTPREVSVNWPYVVQGSNEDYPRDEDDMKLVYDLAKHRKEIPELGHAWDYFNRQQQDDFQNLEENNYDWLFDHTGPDPETIDDPEEAERYGYDNVWGEMNPQEQEQARAIYEQRWVEAQDELANEHRGSQIAKALGRHLGPHYNPNTGEYQNEIYESPPKPGTTMTPWGYR